jgi:hypothetical protein
MVSGSASNGGSGRLAIGSGGSCANWRGGGGAGRDVEDELDVVVADVDGIAGVDVVWAM